MFGMLLTPKYKSIACVCCGDCASLAVCERVYHLHITQTQTHTDINPYSDKLATCCAVLCCAMLDCDCECECECLLVNASRLTAGLVSLRNCVNCSGHWEMSPSTHSTGHPLFTHPTPTHTHCPHSTQCQQHAQVARIFAKRGRAISEFVAFWGAPEAYDFSMSN